MKHVLENRKIIIINLLPDNFYRALSGVFLLSLFKKETKMAVSMAVFWKVVYISDMIWNIETCEKLPHSDSNCSRNEEYQASFDNQFTSDMSVLKK